MAIPELLDYAVERQCSRSVGGVPCGRPPILHVIWEGKTFEPGFVCADHLGEIGTLWTPFAQHALGPDCGMPGSVYVPDENRCRHRDLPTAEPVRAVVAGVPVEVVRS